MVKRKGGATILRIPRFLKKGIEKKYVSGGKGGRRDEGDFFFWRGIFYQEIDDSLFLFFQIRTCESGLVGGLLYKYIYMDSNIRRMSISKLQRSFFSSFFFSLLPIPPSLYFSRENPFSANYSNIPT